MPLLPSQSAAFDGTLTRVKVRLRSGRVVEYNKHQIAAIRSQARLEKGDWVVDKNGLRFVSCDERQRIFEVAKKFEWLKP